MALYLYCNRYEENQCGYALCNSQRNGDYNSWKWFDGLLLAALTTLSSHQSLPQGMHLYSGLHKVHMTRESIDKLQSENAHFVTYMSTTPDLSVAKMFKGEQGMIIEFDESMVAHEEIIKAYVGWVFEYNDEKEVLFARSCLHTKDKVTMHVGWNATIAHSKCDASTQWVRLTANLDMVSEITQIHNSQIKQLMCDRVS